MGDTVGSGAAINVDPFEQLVQAIDEGSVEDARHWLRLCDSDGIDLAQRKITTNNNLTVFGHAIVCTSDPELLGILFTRPEFDVNSLEEVPGLSQPVHLLYLAASAGNTEAATRLCNCQNINVTIGNVASSAFFFMAVKGGDASVIQLLLTKLLQSLPGEEFDALLRSEDDHEMTALHFAAWEGLEEVVALLLDYTYAGAIDVNARGWKGFTALHLATWRNNLLVVDLLLAHPMIDPRVISSPLLFLQAIRKAEPRRELFKYDVSLHGFFPQPLDPYGAAHSVDTTALHCAVLRGQVEIVENFVWRLSSKAQLRKVLNWTDSYGMTPLHYAIARMDSSIVQELLASPIVRGHVQDETELSPLDMAYILLEKAAQDINVVRELSAIISMLLQRSDVQGFVGKQYKDRQIFVDAANAMLVGAALIASISFAGWLQPPLGYQPYYESRYLLMGTAPPQTYESYAAVRQHGSVQVFWIFNSLSFFFAITAMVTGAGAVLPFRANVGIVEVGHTRTLLIRASIVLCTSVFFVLGAFIAAGFASLPPTVTYQWGMIATSVAGGSMCLVALLYFYKRIFRLLWLGNVKPGLVDAVRITVGDAYGR